MFLTCIDVFLLLSKSMSMSSNEKKKDSQHSGLKLPGWNSGFTTFWGRVFISPCLSFLIHKIGIESTYFVEPSTGLFGKDRVVGEARPTASNSLVNGQRTAGISLSSSDIVQYPALDPKGRCARKCS